MRLREHEGIIPGRIDILYCRPDAITIDEGYNVRDLTTPEARAELDELKAQVKEAGILTPLKIRFDGETIILVEGHRRRTVALELIEEYKASGGKEGRNIESVPIFPEAPGTTIEERDAGLALSNSGSRLKPLELGNLIFRMHSQRGLPHERVAQMLGISMPVLRNHLALRAIPEEVKEQIRAGDISATKAREVVKNLPKGTDPAEAAKLIAENKAENKRLGVGAKRDHKVTAKTLQRDKPKPAALDVITDEEKAARASALAYAKEREAALAAPSMAQVHETIAQITNGHAQTHEAVIPLPSGRIPFEAAPPPRSYDINQKFFSVICRLATIAEGFDLAALDDDHMVEIPAEVLKAADREYRAHVGDV